MASINFFTEDIDFNLKNKNAVRKWLKHIIINEQHSLLQLNYIYCSDEYLLQINSQYLNHNFYTDVITFDNSSLPNKIEGDIFISLVRVSENATNLNISLHSELLRVMVHGLLHLLGYDDHTPSDITTIREKENFYLETVDF
jgi:rRNA maturation RNase YbeY